MYKRKTHRRRPGNLSRVCGTVTRPQTLSQLRNTCHGSAKPVTAPESLSRAHKTCHASTTTIWHEFDRILASASLSRPRNFCHGLARSIFRVGQTITQLCGAVLHGFCFCLHKKGPQGSRSSQGSRAV